VPTASGIALLWQPANPYAPLVLRDLQGAAQHLSVQLQPIEVHSAVDLEGAFAAMTSQ
jgi:hypothetical protein